MVAGPALKSLFSVIIPTYDEVRNIGRMIGHLQELYPGIKVLVMDDNSKDGTIDLVRSMAATNADIELVVRDPADRGLTAAVMDGIQRVATPFYVVMDADFQHPPEVLDGIMSSLEGGADLVIGKRHHKEALRWKRRVSSDAAQLLAHTYLWSKRQPHPSDIMSGLFGARTAMSQQVLREHGSGFERKGFKVLFDLLKFVPRSTMVEEVGYQFGDRAGGESKLSSTIITSILRQCGAPGKAMAYLADQIILNRSGQVMLFTLFALVVAIVIFLN
jgi:dolichol-phosphate mannosyltransferase